MEAVKRDKAMLKVVSEELRSDKEVRLDKKKTSPSVVVCHFFSVQCAVVISLALFLSLGTKHARSRKKTTHILVTITSFFFFFFSRSMNE